MFDKVLDMLLNWLPKLRMFHFSNNLNIKGNREPTNLTLRAQTLSNVIEIFQNTHHVDLYFT